MPVRIEIADEAARITLDRPEKRNALALADIAMLSEALDEAQAAGVRAVVLTGAGTVFSGGADLSDVNDPKNGEANPLSALCDKLQALPLPTIARLNGPVIGGAAELAFACDFRIGAETTRLMVPAARIGIHYEPSGLSRAARVVGWQVTRRIYLLADTLAARALDAAGFLDRLVAPEALDSAVEEMLDAIRGGAPLAVNAMKQTIAELAAGAEDPVAMRRRVERSWASEDLREGLAAMKQRRKPAFRGR